MARRTGAVRPVQVSRGKEHGHTISIDARHWKRNRDGREAIIVNIIDEASRFHVALVLKEGDELLKLDSYGLHRGCPCEIGFGLQRHQLLSVWFLKALSNLMSFESGAPSRH